MSSRRVRLLRGCAFKVEPQPQTPLHGQKLEDMTADDLERLKDSDMITEAITELTKEMPRLVEPLIYEVSVVRAAAPAGRERCLHMVAASFLQQPSQPTRPPHGTVWACGRVAVRLLSSHLSGRKKCCCTKRPPRRASPPPTCQLRAAMNQPHGGLLAPPDRGTAAAAPMVALPRFLPVPVPLQRDRFLTYQLRDACSRIAKLSPPPSVSPDAGPRLAPMPLPTRSAARRVSHTTLPFSLLRALPRALPRTLPRTRALPRAGRGARVAWSPSLPLTQPRMCTAGWWRGVAWQALQLDMPFTPKTLVAVVGMGHVAGTCGRQGASLRFGSAARWPLPHMHLFAPPRHVGADGRSLFGCRDARDVGHAL